MTEDRHATGTMLGTLQIGAGNPVRVMAIINASPESFYKSSVAAGRQAVRDAAERAASEGADILDIGAISTAPYKETYVTAEIEAERMMEAVTAARAASGLPITADTQRASVAKAALECGANAINDVSGLLADREMAPLVARTGCAVIVMANESALSTQAETEPVATVDKLIEEAMRRAADAGIAREKIIIDPGLGFFRKQKLPWYDFDVALLRGLDAFQRFGRPMLVSASRKSFLGKMVNRPDPAQRGAASLAVAIWCANRGANIIRTHDPGDVRDALAAWNALEQ